jgi:hypothetical protein
MFEILENLGFDVFAGNLIIYIFSCVFWIFIFDQLFLIKKIKKIS